jgi:hypothetical protein
MPQHHLTRRRRPLGGRGDERGSVLIAITVVMVITTLTMAVFARTVEDLTNVRVNQDVNAAQAQADAGLSDALFRIDQYGTTDSTSFCVGGSAKCTVGSVPGAPGVSYSAVTQDNNTYQVTSEGTINGRTRVIQATVQRDPAYPFAIFGNGDVTFNGNGSGTIQGTDANGNPDSNLQADVGSNGTITCNSGANEGNGQISYQDSWKGCPSQIPGTGTYQPQDPVTSASCPSPNTNDPPVPCLPSSGVNACPANGTFTGTISGTYYCTTAVTFSGTVTVSGSAAVYVIPAAGTGVNATMSGASINVGGDPRNFALYVAGTGTVDTGNGANAAQVAGLLYAPSASITTNGCKMSLTGALVIGTFTCNGGPNLVVNYDSQMASVLQQNWTVKDYSFLPANKFSTYFPGF